jgi:hypothetical protein
MGREIKRVALDFEWPLDKVWEGFQQPEALQGDNCPDCQGGQTHAGWWLQELSYRFGMLAQDIGEQERADGHKLHPWLAEDQHPHGHWENHKFVVDRPSADIVDLMVGLSKFIDREETPEHLKSRMGGGQYIVYRALLKAAGLEDLVICKTCNGEGALEAYEGQFKEAENWEPTEPPAGEGWQVWETVSEGSPISPVFATRERLILWLMSPAYNWGTSRPLTRQQAENFTESAWAPTGFIIDGEVIPGDQLA